MRIDKKLPGPNLTKSFWLPFLALNLLPLLALAGPTAGAHPTHDAAALARISALEVQDGATQAKIAALQAQASSTQAPASATPLVNVAATTRAAPGAATPSAASPSPANTAPLQQDVPPAPLVNAQGQVDATAPPDEITREPAAVVKHFNPEVTFAELTSGGDGTGLFRGGFNVATNPPNSVAFTEAHLMGMVFKDCMSVRNPEDTFQFKGYPGPGEAAAGYSGPVGFMIVDKHNKGRMCMKRHQDRGDICSREDCIPIRTISGGTLPTASIGDKEFQYCYHEEGETPVCKSFARPLIHRSHATLQAEAKARDEERKSKLKTQLRKTVSNCKKSPDELDVARQAVSTLEELGEEDGVIERLRKQIDKADMELLKKEVNTCDLNDLDDVKQHLKDYIAANPDKHEEVARMYHDLALRKVKHRGATQADFYEADALISEAEQIPGLNPASKETLAGYHQDIKIGTLQAMTQNGITDPNAFWPTWMQAMWDTEKQMYQTCSSASNFGTTQGQAPGSSACGVLTNRLNTLAPIPQVARATEARQAAFQEQVMKQIQQQTNMYNNPAMNQLGGAPLSGMPGQGMPLGVNGQPGVMSGMQGMPGTTNAASPSGFFR